MDVHIGVTDTPKEIDIELAPDADSASVKEEIEAALTGKQPVLWLTDRRGRMVAVPSQKIAYIEVGAEAGDRRIGFVN